MNEGRKVHRGSFVAHSEATEVLPPRIGALNDPSVSVALQFPSVLMGGDLVVAAGRDDRLHVSLGQQSPHFIAVVTTIGNQALGPAACCAASANTSIVKRRLKQ